MYDFQDIKRQAIGQWPEILAAYGIDCKPKKRNVPCLYCGGNDRAFYKNTPDKTLLHCRHCGTHFADKILLDLVFGGDFGRMCKELGDYLNCQPAERQQQVRTQARVAQSTGDLALAKHKIEAAEALEVTKTDFHPILLRYGVMANCYESPGIAGALFPLKISGQLVDWIAYSDSGQAVISGRPAKGSKLVIKPRGQPGKNIFVTPDIIDAYHLFQVSKQQNIVVCCGSVGNLQAAAESLPGDYRIIAAIPNDIDALEALQTCSLDFVMPGEVGRKFCEVDYKYKPTRIHKSKEAGEMFIRRLDND